MNDNNQPVIKLAIQPYSNFDKKEPICDIGPQKKFSSGLHIVAGK